MIMKEDLLKKWLNNELSEQELESFKTTDEYQSYAKILDKAKCFKAPEFDEKTSMQGLTFAIKSKQKSSRQTIIQLIASIAAVVIIGFFILRYAYSFDDTYTINTEVAQIENTKLPDHSEVSLSANSTITYDKSHWKTERSLKLDGEALFHVEKGAQFTVKTTYGDIQVLGTVFNVRSRDYAFDVHCFEGSVSVKINEDTYVLKENEHLSLVDEKVIQNQKMIKTPDWKNSLSVFDSQPLKLVLEELKNYYQVDIITSDVNTNKIFTGSFSHQNLEIALNSITLPLGLSYKVDGESVFLSNK